MSVVIMNPMIPTTIKVLKKIKPQLHQGNPSSSKQKACVLMPLVCFVTLIVLRRKRPEYSRNRAPTQNRAYLCLILKIKKKRSITRIVITILKKEVNFRSILKTNIGNSKKSMRLKKPRNSKIEIFMR